MPTKVLSTSSNDMRIKTNLLSFTALITTFLSLLETKFLSVKFLSTHLKPNFW